MNKLGSIEGTLIKLASRGDQGLDPEYYCNFQMLFDQYYY